MTERLWAYFVQWRILLLFARQPSMLDEMVTVCIPCRLRVIESCHKIASELLPLFLSRTASEQVNGLCHLRSMTTHRDGRVS